MSATPPTLLAMSGAPTHPAPLDRASLVLIDIQEEYRSGNLPLAGVGSATAMAAETLRLARAHAMPVIHVQHRVSDEAPIFNPTLPTFALMPEVAPQGGEATIVKAQPNAFAGTDLDVRLKATGRPEVIFVGMMTHMCVSATVRAAHDLGYRSTVVAGACATRDLPAVEGGVIAAADVHRTALAELADAFAIVVPDAAALHG